jgi:ubiquinone/menaquinone biosynthesis C-methylase UbiE
VEPPPAARLLAEQRARYADFYGTRRWRFRVRYDCRQRRYAVRDMLERLGVRLHERTILDIGFGSGDLLFLAERSCRICGVEVSQSAIHAARAIAERSGYRDHDFRDASEDGTLPYPGGFFDVVICSHVLEHVPDDRVTLAEIRRVLRPSGHALLFVPIEPEGFDPKHRRLYGIGSLADRVRAAGLEPVRVEAQMRWAWPLRFLEIPTLHDAKSQLARLCDGLQHLLALPLPMALAARLDRMLERVGVPGTQALVVAVRV